MNKSKHAYDIVKDVETLTDVWSLVYLNYIRNKFFFKLFHVITIEKHVLKKY